MINYLYDGLGRRVMSSSAADGTRYYVYDGDLVIGEVTVSGGEATPAVAYTWGANGLVSERFLQGAPYSLWYHFGPQGETRQLTDSTGAVGDSYLYTAYGEPVASSGTDRNAFRYGGQVGYYTGPGAGIVLCGARWYNPYSARWMTRDPIGYAGRADLYAYCDESPVGGVDPSGLDLLDDASAFSAGWGDTLTWGGTKIARKYVGEWLGVGDANEAVNYGSAWYSAGEWVGTAHSTAFGALGGWEAAGTSGAGKTFSHWIPKRLLQRTGSRWAIRKFGLSKFNGNYVTEARHFLHDPLYYTTTKGYALTHARLPWVLQQADRVPRLYYGAALGFAYGRSHMILGRESAGGGNGCFD